MSLWVYLVWNSLCFQDLVSVSLLKSGKFSATCSSNKGFLPFVCLLLLGLLYFKYYSTYGPISPLKLPPLLNLFSVLLFCLYEFHQPVFQVSDLFFCFI